MARSALCGIGGEVRAGGDGCDEVGLRNERRILSRVGGLRVINIYITVVYVTIGVATLGPKSATPHDGRRIDARFWPEKRDACDVGD